MTFYVRYILTDNDDITFPQVTDILKTISPDYEVDEDVINFKGELIGLLDINEPGDGIFEGDIDLLTEFAEDKEAKDIILADLEKAKLLVVVQVLGANWDASMDAVEPLFDWFLANHPGLLAVEGGEFWNSAGQLS